LTEPCKSFAYSKYWTPQNLSGLCIWWELNISPPASTETLANSWGFCFAFSQSNLLAFLLHSVPVLGELQACELVLSCIHTLYWIPGWHTEFHKKFYNLSPFWYGLVEKYVQPSLALYSSITMQIVYNHHLSMCPLAPPTHLKLCSPCQKPRLKQVSGDEENSCVPHFIFVSEIQVLYQALRTIIFSNEDYFLLGCDTTWSGIFQRDVLSPSSDWSKLSMEKVDIGKGDEVQSYIILPAASFE
jgi:hypothetical protein